MVETTRDAAAREADLLAKAHALDARALGQIHDQYYPMIYRYALYRTSLPAVAEDIAGEAFLRLLDALHRGRTISSLRGWLLGVAGHLVTDHFRQAPRESEAIPETHPASDSPAAEAEERLRHQQVAKAVRQLTADQQEALALRFGGGHSLEETAQAMGKSVTAVKALQFRAVEALRRTLAEVGHER